MADYKEFLALQRTLLSLFVRTARQLADQKADTKDAVRNVFHQALRCIALNAFMDTKDLSPDIQTRVDAVGGFLDSYLPAEANNDTVRRQIIEIVMDWESFSMPVTVFDLEARYGPFRLLLFVALCRRLREALAEHIADTFAIFRVRSLDKEPAAAPGENDTRGPPGPPIELGVAVKREGEGEGEGEVKKEVAESSFTEIDEEPMTEPPPSRKASIELGGPLREQFHTPPPHPPAKTPGAPERKRTREVSDTDSSADTLAPREKPNVCRVLFATKPVKKKRKVVIPGGQYVKLEHCGHSHIFYVNMGQEVQIRVAGTLEKLNGL